MVFALFLCICHTKYRAGDRIWMICNLHMHYPITELKNSWSRKIKMVITMVFWKHRGKRRKCSQQAISPFPSVFSTHLEIFLPFSSNLKLSSAKQFQLGAVQNLSFGKGIREIRFKSGELYNLVSFIDIKLKQECQDGPGSLTWIFENTLANFFLSLSGKNLQEFLYVCTVQVAPIH